MCGYSRAEADMKGAGEYGAGIKTRQPDNVQSKAGLMWLTEYISEHQSLPAFPSFRIGHLASCAVASSASVSELGSCLLCTGRRTSYVARGMSAKAMLLGGGFS